MQLRLILIALQTHGRRDGLALILQHFEKQMGQGYSLTQTYFLVQLVDYYRAKFAVSQSTVRSLYL